MRISKEENQIVVRFPAKKDRIEPWSGEKIGEMDTLIGLIVRKEYHDEMGFAKRIDRSYKGKPDDVSDFVVKWWDSEEELKEKCEELDLDVAVINSQG